MNYFLNATFFSVLIIARTTVFASENVPFGFKKIISYYENYTSGEYSNQLNQLSKVLWSSQNLNDPQIVLTGEMSMILSVCTHVGENECHKYIHDLKPRRITIYSIIDTNLPKFVLEKRKRTGFKFEVIIVDLQLEEYLPFDYTDGTYIPSLASDITSSRGQKHSVDEIKSTRQTLNSLMGRFSSFKRSVTSIFTSCFKGENFDTVEQNDIEVNNVEWTEQQNVSGITDPFCDEL